MNTDVRKNIFSVLMTSEVSAQDRRNDIIVRSSEFNSLCYAYVGLCRCFREAVEIGFKRYAGERDYSRTGRLLSSGRWDHMTPPDIT